MAAVRPRGRLAREQKAIMTIKFDDAARARMLAEVTPDSFKYDGTPVREMDVRQVDAKFARKYIASFHYSRTMPDSTRFSFAGYMNGKVCGIVCYGMGCGKNQYTALIPGIENGTYVELTRLWCADSYPRNTESKLIAESLKLLPPQIKLVLSFADESQGHIGVIYQATNWIYCGINAGGKMLRCEDGTIKHPRLLGIHRMRHPELRELNNQQLMNRYGYTLVDGGRKHRYVYLRGSQRERREMFRLIEPKTRPYPKAVRKADTKDEFEILGIQH